ncbi:hypothetical protein JCM3774_002838 [Rhodotorula dairenensis]
MVSTRRSLRTASLPSRSPRSSPSLTAADDVQEDIASRSALERRGATQAAPSPTLADLIRLEQACPDLPIDSSLLHHPLASASTAAKTTAQPRVRRISSAPGFADLAEKHKSSGRPQLQTSETLPALPPTPSTAPSPALLLPPHYGRPLRPSSPDALAALFRPVLRSLSRPASPSISPTHTRHPSASQHSSQREEVPRPTATATSLTSAPIDRSSSSLPAQFPPREPTDPAPTVESQGFVLYIGSLVAYGLYLAWAFLPERCLVAIGIEWYPSRDWALLVPAWIVMLVAFVYISYFLLTMYSTPSLALPEPYDDPRAYIPPPPRPELGKHDQSRPPTPLWAHAVLLPEEAIPPLYDLPIVVVERVLYGSSDDDADAEGDEGDKGEEG